MATTYRAFIDTNEYSKRNMVHVAFSRSVKRASKATDLHFTALFKDYLENRLPHEGAMARLEITKNNGETKTVLRLTGRVTEKCVGRCGHSLVPFRGEWITELGVIFARA